ncbi:hypothetical protein SI65_08249 [Aspergillus cristatus]|uniref:BZIP domain-containing protein n=1 Tax=Aspergillus cristatus TaxID=573508 RepID=A0A1E3B5K7_ASPCR|nr:hypothetical protein SI65_08249 [Aspergillus cristatus]
MATLAEHPTVAPSSTTCYDPDIDSFLNLDQITYATEAPRPKASLPSQPAVPSTDFAAGDVRSAGFASNGQTPIAFQAPSHQYDEHKQQTGLPPGALAHAMSFNRANNMSYGSASPGFAMGGNMYPQMKREDPLDFNAIPARNPSEMDMEGDNIGSVPGYFFSPNPNKAQFVDPNALGSQEAVPAGHSTQVGRMYPGMHQQQAAMAKAAQQQRQHEMLRQQQQQLQQRRMGGQTQQNNASQPRPQRNSDPVVEERISRLLQQIRQSSMSSPSDSPSPSLLPQMAKAKKEEQDMDEDERLLASEEGKKLSSKERRQLRNKVSARAFRSRRKEYIGQLESEIASRTNESHELRIQNRALYEENARLTDLAHMLLSSPQFSNFMEEMNVSGLPQLQTTSKQQPQQSQPQPQQQQQPAQPSQPPMQASVPEATQNQAPQDFQMQQNMVMVPNQGMDMTSMGLNGGWNSGIDINYANTPVFAVMEMPEGPTLDAEVLSGKSSSFGSILPESTKQEAPVLERAPQVEEPKEVTGVENPDVEIDESDPAFALFVDSVKSQTHTEESFEGVKSEKAPAFELVVESDSKTTEARFAQLCLSMEASFERVSMVTSHLS